VVAIDALSYAVFAAAALSVRTPLRPPALDPAAHHSASGNRSAFRVLLRDPVLVATTVAFMAFNIAEGMFTVVAPWLAKTRLAGGAATLGLLLAAMSAGEFVGAAAAGSRQAPRNPVRAISRTQVLAGLGFLAFLAVPHTPVLVIGVLAVGVFATPMTVWAQSVRMQRIPPELRGRGFATLRTLMLATPPIGAALAAPLVAAGRPGAAAVGMAALASLPGLALVFLFRREPRLPGRDPGTGWGSPTPEQ
jgi:predicted MFS family arabinose efflux permease